MSAVTSSVTSVAPTYMMTPSRWIDAADGPAGSRVDCGPLHPANSTSEPSRGDPSGRSLRSLRIGLLQGVEIGRHVPGLLGREPHVGHAGLRQERRRVLQ